MPRKTTGSFWPYVRKRMREKAVEIYMRDHTNNPYFKGQTPEWEELVEGGYMHRAKVEVLKKIQMEAKQHAISKKSKG